MKRIKWIYPLILLFVSHLPAHSQGQGPKAKSPSIVIIPDEGWLEDHNYFTAEDNQGKTVKTYDFVSGLRDRDMQSVIQKLQELLVANKCPNVDDAMSTLSKIDIQNAEDEALMSDEGIELSRGSFENIRNRLRPDVTVRVRYYITANGPEKYTTFNLQATDAYTNEPIAAAGGPSKVTTSHVLPLMLETAVLDKLPNFADALNAYYVETEELGRKIRFRIETARNGALEDGLETEIGGDYLYDIIENWVRANTVDGNFNVPTSTRNQMAFDDVRIPLFNNRGQAIDAGNWGRGLNELLRKACGLKTVMTPLGLGEFLLIIR
ncbi:MAG: DUF6175 family protein [Tannerella sp.]|jgi:hypothetical protein|nr:DUF6175 family protein [Tannerella sp.]